MNDKALQALYKDLSGEYEVGSYDDFKSYMANPTNRKKLYDNVIVKRYNVSDYNQFESTYATAPAQGEPVKKKESTIGGIASEASVSEAQSTSQGDELAVQAEVTDTKTGAPKQGIGALAVSVIPTKDEVAYKTISSQRQKAVDRDIDANAQATISEIASSISPETEAQIQTEYENYKATLPIPQKPKDYNQYRLDYIKDYYGIKDSKGIADIDARYKAKSEAAKRQRELDEAVSVFAKKFSERPSSPIYSNLLNATKLIEKPKEGDDKAEPVDVSGRFKRNIDTPAGTTTVDILTQGISSVPEGGIQFYANNSPRRVYVGGVDSKPESFAVDELGNRTDEPDKVKQSLSQFTPNTADALTPVDDNQYAIFKKVIEDYATENPEKAKQIGRPQTLYSQSWDRGDYRLKQEWDVVKDGAFVREAIKYQKEKLANEYTQRVTQLEKQFAQDIAARPDKQAVYDSDFEVQKANLALQYNSAEKYLDLMYNGYVRANIKNADRVETEIAYQQAERDIKEIEAMREADKQWYNKQNAVVQFGVDVWDGFADAGKEIVRGVESLGYLATGTDMPDEQKRFYVQYDAMRAGSDESLVRDATSMIAQTAAIMAPAGWIGGTLKTLGVGAKVAQTTGIVTSSYLQTAGTSYIDAMAQGMDSETAMVYGNVMGLSQGFVEAIFPSDYLFGGVRTQMKKNIVNILKNASPAEIRRMTSGQVIRSAFSEFANETKKEMVEEVAAYLSEKGINFTMNQVTGKDILDDEVTIKDMANAAGGAAIVGTFFGGSRVIKSFKNSAVFPVQMQYEYLAASDPDGVMEKIEFAKKEGALTDVQYKNAKDRLNSLVEQKKAVDAASPEMSEFNKAVLVNMRADKDEAVKYAKTLDETDPVDARILQTMNEKIATIDALQNDILKGEDAGKAYAKYLNESMGIISRGVEEAGTQQPQAEVIPDGVVVEDIPDEDAFSVFGFEQMSGEQLADIQEQIDLRESGYDEMAEIIAKELGLPEGTVATVEDLAAAYLEAQNPDVQTLRDGLRGLRVNRDSFVQFADKNYITQGLARAWFTRKKDRSGRDLDEIAQEISEMRGQEVTPQDIVDIIVENPNGIPQRSERAARINDLYKQKTGKNLNTSVAAKILNKRGVKAVNNDIVKDVLNIFVGPSGNINTDELIREIESGPDFFMAWPYSLTMQEYEELKKAIADPKRREEILGEATNFKKDYSWVEGFDEDYGTQEEGGIDAIQEQGATAVDVQEQAADGEKVVEGTPESGREEAAQEGQEAVSFEAARAVEPPIKERVELTGTRADRVVIDRIKEGASESAKALLDRLPNVMKALRRSGVNVRIVLHPSAESFNGVDGETVSMRTGNAKILPDGTIHIDMSSATTTAGSLVHEAVHQVISDVIAADPIRLAKMANDLRDTLKKAMPDVHEDLEEFTQQYEPQERDEEYVAEFMAMVADGYVDIDKLSPPKRKSVLEWFNRLLNAFGFDSVKITDTMSAIDVAAAINRALEEGVRIKSKVSKANRAPQTRQQKFLDRMNASRDSKGLPRWGEKKQKSLEQQAKEMADDLIKDFPDEETKKMYDFAYSYHLRQLQAQNKPKYQRVQRISPEFRKGLIKLSKQYIENGTPKDQIIEGLKEQGILSSQANAIYTEAKNQTLNDISQTDPIVKDAVKQLESGIKISEVSQNVIAALPDNKKALSAFYVAAAMNRYLSRPNDFKATIDKKVAEIKQKAKDKAELKGDKDKAAKEIKKAKAAIKRAMRGKSGDKRLFARDKTTLKTFVGINHNQLSDESKAEYLAVLASVASSVSPVKVSNIEDEYIAQNARREYTNDDIDALNEKYLAEVDSEKRRRLLDKVASFYSQMDMALPEEFGSMTVSDLQALAANILSEEQLPDVDKEQEQQLKRQALLELAAEYVAEAVAAMDSGVIDTESMTPLEKRIIDGISNGSVDALSLNEIKTLIKGMDNFVTNGSLDGMGKIAARMEAPAIVKQFLAEKVKMCVKFGNLDFFTRFAGSMEQYVESVAGSSRLGAKFYAMSGMAQVYAGGSRADKRMVDGFLNPLGELYKKYPDTKTPESIMARFIYGFMNQNYGGTADEVAAEFERRKGLLVSDIEAKKKSKRKDLREQAELEQRMFDMLVADASTIKDVVSAMTKNGHTGAREIVDLAVSFASTYANEYDEISRVYNNNTLDLVNNYLPNKTKKTAIIRDEDLGIDQDINSVDPSVMTPSSTKNRFKSMKRLEGSRVYDVDFDAMVTNEFRHALTYIETLPHIMRFKAVMNTNDLIEEMGEKNVKFLDLKMTNGVKILRRMYPSDEYARALSKATSGLASLGANISLAGITQPMKQVLPVAFRAMTAAAVRKKGAAAALHTTLSGANYNEGLFSKGTILSRKETRGGYQFERLEDSVVKAQRGVLSKAFGKYLSARRKAADLTMYPLTQSDYFAARKAWVSYYAENLLQRGVYKSWRDIDWQKESADPNEEASAYAEIMLSRSQNVNTMAAASEMMTRTGGYKDIWRNIFFPFASFTMNNNVTRWINFKRLLWGSPTEKAIAFGDITAQGVEALAFNSIKLLLIYPLRIYLVKEVLKAMFDYDDEEVDAIVSSNELPHRVHQVIAQSTIDMTFGGFSSQSDMAVKYAVNDYYKNVLLPFFDVDTDKDLFYQGNMSSDEISTFLSSIGSYGILAQQLLDIADVAESTMFGFSDTIMLDPNPFDASTEKVEYKMTEDQQRALQMYLIFHGVTMLTGLNDVDARTIVNKIQKGVERDIKRGGKTGGSNSGTLEAKPMSGRSLSTQSLSSRRLR
jgi:hypothetical protein